ncbi:hypothetical protein [Candidatus Lokiarchaeum ossiferum]
MIWKNAAYLPPLNNQTNIETFFQLGILILSPFIPIIIYLIEAKVKNHSKSDKQIFYSGLVLYYGFVIAGILVWYTVIMIMLILMLFLKVLLVLYQKELLTINFLTNYPDRNITIHHLTKFFNLFLYYPIMGALGVGLTFAINHIQSRTIHYPWKELDVFFYSCSLFFLLGFIPKKILVEQSGLTKLSVLIIEALIVFWSVAVNINIPYRAGIKIMWFLIGLGNIFLVIRLIIEKILQERKKLGSETFPPFKN